MPLSTLYESVPRQIERLSQRNFQWLSFPKALEDAYERDVSAYRLGRLWLEGLLATGIFNLFLFANLIWFHTVDWHDVVLRSALITPVALLVNFTMLKRPARFYRETLIGLAACWVCFTHLYLELGSSAMGPAYAQVGVIVTVLFSTIVMRLQFPYALATSAALAMGDLVFLKLDRVEDTAQKVFGASLTLCAISMTIMANYSLEREERLAYLLLARGELQSKQLSLSNEELQRISNQDGLTGLANRHAFGSEYQRLWKQALTSRAPISAILIDIDYFKTVNDLCGHLYGDQVLQRVALLLQQALRGKSDFAARFGGEEFVVLLPGASPEVAMLVAERVRKLVEVAGGPALETIPDLPSLWATVSCGVATCWPTHTDLPEDLLDAADKALYEAKQNGRNRVSYGEMAIKPVALHL